MSVGLYVRVPVPAFGSDGGDYDEAPKLTRAVSRLREAKSMAANQEWERCVGGCRNVLELLRDVAQIPKPGEMPTAKRERSKAQRWAALFDDAWSLTSAANHDDGVTSQIRWTRGDADAALAITAALLARYSVPDQ